METKYADVEEGKRLRSLGFYGQAVTVLSRAAESPTTRLEAVFELGESLLLQGYYSRALEILDKGLCNVKVTEDTFLPPTQMLRCCIAAIVTAKIKTCVDEAQLIYNALGEGEPSGISDHCRVLMESYYSGIQQLALNCRVISMSESLSCLSSRLEALFNGCMSAGQYDDALRLARRYLEWSDLFEPTALLRQIVNNPKVSSLIKATAQAAIGKNLESQSNFAECDIWNDEAAKLFEDNGHAHGSLDISTRKACRSADGETIIDQNLKKYQQMDYPAGIHSALLLLLDLVLRLHMFEMQTKIIAEFEKLVNDKGALLLRYMTLVQAIAVFGKTLVDSGKVISGASALYQELSNSECSFLQGQAAQLASQAYLKLKDKPAALSWAVKCQSAWKDCNIEDRSTASTLLLMVAFDEPQEIPDLDEAIKAANQLIREDIANNLAENAIEKINILMLGLTMNRERYAELIQTLMEEVNKLSERISTASAESKLASMFQIHAGHLLGESKAKGDIEGENNALDILERAVKLYLKNQQLWEAANSRQACGLCYFQMYQKHLHGAPMQRAKDLDNALKQFTCAQEAFVAIDATFQIGIANYWIALTQYEAWCYGWISGKEVLGSIIKAENYMDRQRNEVSVLQGLSAIQSKQRLSTDKNTRDMYRFALQICIKEGDMRNSWQWVQKAKARSLSDLLGLGMLVPQALRTLIAENPAAQSLFQEEERLVSKIKMVPDLERFSLRAKLDMHRSKMRDIPALKELLDMREGVPLELGALYKLPQLDFSSATPKGRATVYADWIVKGDEILLFTVQQGKTPAVHHLSIKAPVISSWIEEFDASYDGWEDSIMEMNDADNPLRTLDPLIAPLEIVSTPGDLIVMCPADMLHSLPLHALLLPNRNSRTTLVERNPTVYCASLTTFAQCCQRAEDAVPQTMIARDILAIYEPLPDQEDFDYDEQNDIYTNATVLGAQIKARNILCGDRVTPEVFQKVVSESHLLYFHGHCDLIKGHITEQSLRLSDGHGAAAPFTMKEFFDLQMDSPLFILMACNSATQQILVGNESLGLITAILIAGASSIIGTLWEVTSETARIFAERFTQKLIDAGGTGIIDLAVALQQTVMSLKQDYNTRLPYHWAPFVLHGSWFSRKIGPGGKAEEGS